MTVKKKALKKPGFFGKLFGRKPKINAVTEIRNLIADKGVKNIDPEEIEEIAGRYNVRVSRKFPKELKNIYREYMENCLIDLKLSGDEVKALKRLRTLLDLDEQDAVKIRDQVASKHYRESMDKVLQDANISKEERNFLQELQNCLKLPADMADRIEKEAKTHKIKSVLKDTVKDKRLSPEEEEELYTLADNLNIELSFKEKTRKALQRYKLYWLVEKGSIPEIDVGIKLYKKEKCYYVAPANWYVRKKRTKRLRYSGPTARIKLARGIYWRMGDLGLQTVSQEEWEKVDEGEFFVTSHRLIFKGQKENTMIRLNRILDFELYENGVEIQKGRGKNPFFAFEPEDPRLFALILNRAIDDYSN